MIRNRLFILLCLITAPLSLQGEEPVKYNELLFSDQDQDIFSAPDFDDSSWSPLYTNNSSANGDKRSYWLRVDIDFAGGLPFQSMGVDSSIFPGANELFFNGVSLGKNWVMGSENRYYIKNRIYEIPGSLIKSDGNNILAVRVRKGSHRIFDYMRTSQIVAPYSSLLKRYYLAEFSQIFLIIILLFIAFSLLRGFYNMSKKSIYLILALNIFMSSIFFLLKLNISPPILNNMLITARLQYIALLAIMPTFTLFILRYLRKKVTPFVIAYCLLQLISMLLITVSRSTTIWYTTIGIILPITSIIITAYLVRTLISEMARLKSLVIILASLAAVTVAVTVDLLCFYNIFTIQGYYNYGLLSSLSLTLLHIVIFNLMFKPTCKNYLEHIKRDSSKGAELKEALEKLEENYKRTDNAYFETIKRLSIVAEYRDRETGNHIRRVGFYVKVMAELLGLDKDEVELLQYASYMHDVGKIGIPDRILFKKGPLTDSEWEIMKSHTEIGAGIFHDTESEILKMAREIALYHHEKYDGSGYPYGLKGDEIPFSSQIMAIADTYDALRSERPYKKGFSHEETIKIMSASEGRVNRHHYSPVMLELFLENDALFDIIYNSDFSENSSDNLVEEPEEQLSLNVI